MSYQITQIIGLFDEYRFTHFQTQHVLEEPVVLTESFNTHHLIAGLLFRFSWTIRIDSGVNRRDGSKYFHFTGLEFVLK